MTTEIDLQLVRELNPAEEGPSEQTRERARATLLAEVDRAPEPLAAEVDREREPRVRPTRPRLRLRLGFAGAAVVAVALLLVLVRTHGGVVRPERAAAALLQRAAGAAEASTGPRGLRPGEYWYVHSRETRLGVTFGHTAHPLFVVDARRSRDRQLWIGRGVRGHVTERAIGPIRFLSASGRRRWLLAGRPGQLDAKADFALGADAFALPYAKLRGLPTDVDALRRVVAEHLGTGSAASRRHEMLVVIGDLLREDPVPARVRAALYRVLASIPGIRLLGRTRDGIGRPAVAVALQDSAYGERVEFLFDPRSANLVGERYTVVKPGPRFRVAPGTVEYESTYISSGIVQRIGQRPRR